MNVHTHGSGTHPQLHRDSLARTCPASGVFTGAVFRGGITEDDVARPRSVREIPLHTLSVVRSWHRGTQGPGKTPPFSTGSTGLIMDCMRGAGPGLPGTREAESGPISDDSTKDTVDAPDLRDSDTLPAAIEWNSRHIDNDHRSVSVSSASVPPAAPRADNAVAYLVGRLVPLVVLLMVLIATTLVGRPGVSRAAAGECADVEVVFARGTHEAPGIGVTGQHFIDAPRQRVGERTVDVYAVNYPASMDFARVVDGVIDTNNRIRATADRCPGTEIVLGGYSQGAAVNAYSTRDDLPAGYDLPTGWSGPLPSELSNRVAAVVLFG